MKCFNFEDLTELEEINSNAFAGSGIENVTLLSKNIKELWDTFENCDNLKYADLSGCTNLASLYESFKNSGIEKIKLPESIALLGCATFVNCKNLSELDLSHCKNFECTVANPIFTNSGIKLLKYPKNYYNKHINSYKNFESFVREQFSPLIFGETTTISYDNVTIMIGDKVFHQAGVNIENPYPVREQFDPYESSLSEDTLKNRTVHKALPVRRTSTVNPIGNKKGMHK